MQYLNGNSSKDMKWILHTPYQAFYTLPVYTISSVVPVRHKKFVDNSQFRSLKYYLFPFCQLLIHIEKPEIWYSYLISGVQFSQHPAHRFVLFSVYCRFRFRISTSDLFFTSVPEVISVSVAPYLHLYICRKHIMKILGTCACCCGN